MSGPKRKRKRPNRLIVTPLEFEQELFGEVWDEVVGSRIAEANTPLRTPRFDPPPRLLHFTSAAGLEAILRTGILRLSQARGSNDPMELTYGLRLARDVIRELGAADETEREFQRGIDAGTRDRSYLGGERRIVEPHVCCFAAPLNEPDPTETSIAHWALYGRNGAGFVLVLDGAALAGLRLVDFFPVSYEPAGQRAKLEVVVKIAKKTAIDAYRLAQRKRAREEFALYVLRSTAHAFGSILAMHSAAMKGPMHAFEREWRLMVSYLRVKSVGKQQKFGVQASGPLLRSYYERPFPKSALLEVIVGAKHYELNEIVVTAMLDDLKYRRTKVRRGEVNIRGAEGT